MKILHLITDLDVGGAEVMLYNIVKEHQKRGVEIIVVGLSGDGIIGEKINQLGIKATSIGMRPGSINIKPLLTLAKLVGKFKPDVIQTWMYHADLIGSIMALKNGNIPVVWGVHHTLNKTGSLKLTTQLVVKMNAILSRWLPEKIICCSNASYRSHLKQGYDPGKMFVIQNGIDLEKYHIDQAARISVRKELGLETNVPLIGMLARFHPQKDHCSFILAAEKLNSNYPGVHFILAGKDIQTSNNKLVTWIRKSGLENQFHLLGLRMDSPRLYAALDVYTLSSAFGEALPVSICEAMACGVPCVVTDVGDSGEIVGEIGICVQPGDPMELANGWKRFLSLSADELADFQIRAKQRIEGLYNIIIVADRYFKTYKSICYCDD